LLHRFPNETPELFRSMAAELVAMGGVANVVEICGAVSEWVKVSDQAARSTS
jgi:hypothetical protein